LRILSLSLSLSLSRSEIQTINIPFDLILSGPIFVRRIVSDNERGNGGGRQLA